MAKKAAKKKKKTIIFEEEGYNPRSDDGLFDDEDEEEEYGSYPPRRQHVLAPKLEDALKTAFDNLREKGFIAERKYWCCQSCACSRIHHRVTEAGLDPDVDDINYVFYHEQDDERLQEKAATHLAWGGDGKAIVEELKKQPGVVVEWDGTNGQRIQVGMSTLAS